jgi:hypothetical protein
MDSISFQRRNIDPVKSLYVTHDDRKPSWHRPGPLFLWLLLVFLSLLRPTVNNSNDMSGLQNKTVRKSYQ